MGKILRRSDGTFLIYRHRPVAAVTSVDWGEGPEAVFLSPQEKLKNLPESIRLYNSDGSSRFGPDHDLYLECRGCLKVLTLRPGDPAFRRAISKLKTVVLLQVSASHEHGEFSKYESGWLHGAPGVPN